MHETIVFVHVATPFIRKLVVNTLPKAGIPGIATIGMARISTAWKA
jgi:hypothetical protein